MSDHIQVLIERRPFTHNQLTGLIPIARARTVKSWRQEATSLCAGKKPVKTPVKVIVWTFLRHNYKRDCGSDYPTVKAIIDGIVDAGIIPDDGPETLHSIEMNAPFPGSEKDAVLVVVKHDP